MSSLGGQHGAQHPEEGMLLRYIDGELPGRKLRQVERHIQACWQCRTELEELQKTVAGCVRYRKNVLQAYLPDPPNPWPDLYREFDRIDSSANGGFSAVAKQLAARLVAQLGGAGVRRWAFGAVAALVLVCAVWYQFRETPSVQAAALLKRAVLAADAQTAPTRRIEIRTRHHKITRTVSKHQAAVLDAGDAPVEALFVAAHYDWNDPLSARSFQTWRAGVAAPRDEVTSTPDGFQVRTLAGEGELTAASLVLRPSDLRPVEGRLEFRNQDWVEMKDVTDATTRDDGGPVATNVEPPLRPAVPSRPAATAPGPASISDELQVLAALHEIGADLGDPIEVKRSGDRVVVSGVGIPAERQKQIHGLFDAMPKVAVRFADPSATTAVPEPVEPADPGATAASTPPAALQTRMEQKLGGKPEFEKFSSQMLDRNEALMSRAYALRRLAERFATDSEIPAADRAVLREMARGHADAMARETADLDRVLRPLLTSLGGSVTAPPVATAPQWQPAAGDVFRAAHRVEMQLSVLLGVTPDTAAGGHLPSDLLAAIAELRANLDSCRSLLAQQ